MYQKLNKSYEKETKNTKSYWFLRMIKSYHFVEVNKMIDLAKGAFRTAPPHLTIDYCEFSN